MENDLKEIIELGDRIDVQMARLNEMIKCQELKDHLDVLFSGIKENLKNIKALGEITHD